MDWDPEIDTPATIAIIGAGPIGVEAALYARFLGYHALLFDAGKVADSVLKWGHLTMFTPFGANSSTLGLAALEAHESLAGVPGPDEYLTGRQYVERYLVPLARTDLVYDSVRVHSIVQSIGRTQSRRCQRMAPQDRADEEFRIVVQSKNRGYYSERADLVLDCGGTFHSPRAMGPGGGLAIGETDFSEHIERGFPDVLGAAREKYARRHTLLVGSGLSSASLAVAISKLVREEPGTRLTWVLSHRHGTESSTPQLAEHLALNNQFARRGDVVREAARLLDGACEGVAPVSAWGVERLERSEVGLWNVRLLTGEEATLDLTCDQIISAVGHRPDWRLAEALRIERCVFTDAPAATAARLRSATSPDDLSCANASDVLTTEPHYYVLGAKSFGTDSRFLIQHGFQQIRQVFALIGNRADLNLYESVRPREMG